MTEAKVLEPRRKSRNQQLVYDAMLRSGRPMRAYELLKLLRSTIRMMHEPASMDGPPFMQSLFESVEDEARMGCPAYPPADNATGIGVDDEGDVDAWELVRACPDEFVQ